MAIATVILAASFLERWGSGFANGAILGAIIGAGVWTLLKVVRSLR